MPTRRRRHLAILLGVPALALLVAAAFAGAAIFGLELRAIRAIGSGAIHPPPADNPPTEEEAFEEEKPIAHWRVSGDTLTPVGEVEPGTAAQAERIWRRFTDLFPPSRRQMLSEYEVFRGRETSAAVGQTDTDLEEWTLAVNISEANSGDLDSVLIHEFGHLLTLNATQVPPDTHAPESPTAYRRKALQCAPRYYTGEGCAYDGSYIDEFVERFWTGDMLEEVRRIEAIDDEAEWVAAVDAFARDHRGEFVTDYAASNPAEDVAESWTAFVLEARPRGTSVKNDKILWFWEHPELVELRREIREQL